MDKLFPDINTDDPKTAKEIAARIIEDDLVLAEGRVEAAQRELFQRKATVAERHVFLTGKLGNLFSVGYLAGRRGDKE